MSELEINPKMVKRLAWVDERDTDLVQWLASYIRQHQWVSQASDMSIDVTHDAVLVEYFINQHAKYWVESPNTRERCRNMKSAWNSCKKRKSQILDEGRYTISRAARKELERLAKRHNCSFSKVIEILLVNAGEIEHLQKAIKKRLEDVNYGYRVDTAFLGSFFSSDVSKSQAEIMHQALKQQLDLDRKKYREEIQKLKLEVRELKAMNGNDI